MSDALYAAEAELHRVLHHLFQQLPRALWFSSVPPVRLTGVLRQEPLAFPFGEPVVRLDARRLLDQRQPLVALLLHQFVHILNAAAGITDCSPRHYHNRNFAQLARSLGLTIVRRDRRFGWAATELSMTPQLSAVEAEVTWPILEALRPLLRSSRRPGEWRCGVNHPFPLTTDRRLRQVMEYPLSEIPRYSLRLHWEKETRTRNALRIRNDTEAAMVLWKLLGTYTQEALAVLCLDRGNRLIGYDIPFVGQAARVTVEPRPILLPALLLNASALIVGHNHPGGNVMPSRQDQFFTVRLATAAELIGLKLHASLVVAGPGRWRRVPLLELIEAEEQCQPQNVRGRHSCQEGP